jgi:hypothetical protein
MNSDWRKPVHSTEKELLHSDGTPHVLGDAHADHSLAHLLHRGVPRRAKNFAAARPADLAPEPFQQSLQQATETIDAVGDCGMNAPVEEGGSGHEQPTGGGITPDSFEAAAGEPSPARGVRGPPPWLPPANSRTPDRTRATTPPRRGRTLPALPLPQESTDPAASQMEVHARAVEAYIEAVHAAPAALETPAAPAAAFAAARAARRATKGDAGPHSTQGQALLESARPAKRLPSLSTLEPSLRGI